VNPNLKTQSLERGTKAFIQIYFCIILVLFFWVAINIARFPYGADYGEAPLMDQVKKIQMGETIYKSDLNSSPYVIANYPPLYPLLVAGITSTFDSLLFQTGRLVALFFSIISGAAIGLFTFSLTNKKILAIFSAAIFWGNPYVIIWSAQARVDMMALAFCLLGLYILFKRKNSIAWLLVSCLCFILSIYTRQTYLLAGPLAGFIWLLKINRKHAFLFLATLTILSLLLFGMINALTQGGFYSNIVTANINEISLSRTVTMFKQLFIIWPVILIMVAVLLIQVFQMWNKSRRDLPATIETHEFSVYGLSTFTAGALLTALTVGKVGSDVNYFLEIIAACSIWMAIGLSQLMNSLNKRNVIILGLLLLQLVWIIIGAIPITGAAIESRWNMLPSYNSLYKEINTAAQKGIVLSDDFLDMVVLSSQPIYYQPFEYGQLYNAGLWDPTELVEQIEHKEFPLVVIGGETVYKECCWPDPVAAALESNYKINTQPGLLILTPEIDD